MRYQILKRASFIGAFFVFAGYILSLSTAHAASDCRASTQAAYNKFSFQEVDKIYDGDTLRLQDGRKIRLIGINTPELGRDGAADQPYAQSARQRLVQMIEANNNKIGILQDQQDKDRYGRTLAHIFTEDGTNISAELIREGLGWHIVVTPNTSLHECYADAQTEARSNKLGVWKKPEILDIAWIEPENTGFHFIRGQIISINKSQRYVWLNFPFNFSIKIQLDDLQYFTDYPVDDLLHKQIETSGWLYSYMNKGKAEIQMQLYHPSVLRILN